VVDRDDDARHLPTLRGAGIPSLLGDVRDPETLRRAGVDRAALLLVVTGDDLLNEATALLGLTTAPADAHLVAVAHTHGHEATRRNAHGWLNSALTHRFHTFDSWDLAAAALVEGLTPDDLARPIVIAGCGKLGDAIVKKVLDRDRLVELTVLDRDPAAIANWTHHARVRAVVADLMAPGLAIALNEAGDSPLVLVCTDSDTSNLIFAHRVRTAACGEPRVVVRVSEWPDASDLPGLQIASVTTLVNGRLQQELDSWLTGA
jgi:Trk K+ transport system NAD-binding subunit